MKSSYQTHTKVNKVSANETKIIKIYYEKKISLTKVDNYSFLHLNSSIYQYN